MISPLPDFTDLGVKVNVLPIQVNEDSTIPNREVAEQVLAEIKDHTAMMICGGGATSLDIYRRIVEVGYKIPERLSIVIDSGRYDYFIRTFRIASIYSSAWDEGSCCMTELLAQLRSGSVNFMIRKSHYTYMDGTSIAEAISEAELKRFDSQLQISSKNNRSFGKKPVNQKQQQQKQQ
jgi:DNA-binding LacI/PurR family transcriptional regulator